MTTCFCGCVILTSLLLLRLGVSRSSSSSMMVLQSHKEGRILWQGPLFGRLSKAGRDLLIRKGGWEYLPTKPLPATMQNYYENNARLQFIWPSKTGPQYDMHDTKGAHIRPYPKAVTDILDDKKSLAELLSMDRNAEDEKKVVLAPKVISSPQESEPGKLYFVKHRFGAQGKSVYVYDKQELQEWWGRCKNPSDFVVQQEVVPALDESGRKFVLRVHILMVQQHQNPLRAFLHNHIICLPHASPYKSYTEGNHSQTPKSALVSQAGKKHPPPMLLQDLAPSHPAAGLWKEIYFCVSKLVYLAATGTTSTHPVNPFRQEIGESTTCFALLGADLLVSRDGVVEICEVNSHPALGWGTMRQVDSSVFRRLIEDTMSIVVFDESNGDTQFTPILIQ